MSGPNEPVTPPPEVPEEFADAYRAAFERALESGEQEAGAHAAGVEAVADEMEATGSQAPIPPLPAEAHIGDPRRITEYRAATPFERVRESGWFVPLVVAALALVLVGGAYGVGKAFSAKVEPGPTAGSQQSASPGGKDGGTKSAKKPDKKAGKPWPGKVAAVKLAGARTDCVLPPSVDAAGHEVSYPPANMLDADPSTAWRCAGKAIGQQVVLSLPKDTKVGQVGLVAGYAKTDPADGTDRYAENNRITKVRWTFPDGTSVDQTLDGSPHHRALQTVRVPPTTADQVTLEILAVTRGSRNTTAISTVQVAATR